MKLKQKCSILVKLVATGAACLTLVPSVSAQTSVRRDLGTPPIQTRQMSSNTAPSRLQPTTRVNASEPSPGATPGRTFVPNHLRSSGIIQSSYAVNQPMMEGETIIGEETIFGGETMMGQPLMESGCGDCGEFGCEVGCDVGCGDPCGYGNGCDPCGYNRMPSLISLADMEYYVGTQGFKGSINLGQGGSFGFNESINWGFPLPLFTGLGLSGQVGVRAIQSNLNGTGFTTGTPPTFVSDTRNQTYVSGGIFRRVDYGLQMGVVFDYLNEDWYFNSSFGQIRGEFGWVGAYGNLFGFRFATGTDDGPDLTQQIQIASIVNSIAPPISPFSTFIPLDTYRFFYRHNVAQTGARIEGFAGFTGQSKALLGADAWVPITDNILLRTSATLMIDDGPDGNANVDEAWNVSSGLVFYPKGWTRWKRAYHGPLFDVADNGTFLFGRR